MKTLANSLIAFALLMIIMFAAWLISLGGCAMTEVMRLIGGFALSWVCFQIAEKITDKINKQ